VTQPANTIKKGNARYYVWPPVGAGERELEVPSVTTIINGGIPKDALKFWAAKMAAQYAIDHKASWENLPPGDALDLIQRSALRYTSKRADEGSLVHNALEDYVNGLDRKPPEDPELAAQFAGAKLFLTDCEVEVIYSEPIIYSRKHGYAGSADLIANVLAPGWDAPKLCIVDYKTGKAIYPEMGIQLTAYSRGDFLGIGLQEVAFPGPIKDGIIVRPKRDGGYEAQHFELTNDLFKLFLAAKVVHKRSGVCTKAKGRVWEVAA
jgi:hypothetical protein